MQAINIKKRINRFVMILYIFCGITYSKELSDKNIKKRLSKKNCHQIGQFFNAQSEFNQKNEAGSKLFLNTKDTKKPQRTQI